MLKRIYQDFILKYPARILSFLIIAIFSFGYYATKLEIDASAETLLLENDPTLQFTREVSKHFTSGGNMLIVTYTPKSDLLSDESLEGIKSLSKELNKLPFISSIDSILTVPLLLSPPKPISELIKEVPTLSSEKVDKKLAKLEFLSNPLYKGNLVSSDAKTTAILLNLDKDVKYSQLLEKKRLLQSIKKRTTDQEEKLKETLEPS